MNAGQDFVGDDLCDHYAFRQGKIDWQIWITAGGKPLPRKIVITNRADEARPQSVSLIDWNLKPDLHGCGIQVHAAQGCDQDRDRSAEDQVEERHHEEIIRQIASGCVGRPRCGQLRDGPYADARRWWGWWWWRRRRRWSRCGGGGGGSGGARAAGGGGGTRQNAQANNSRADARTNNVRSTSVNNVNNVNVERNVNVK